jgi:hypothetical protein
MAKNTAMNDFLRGNRSGEGVVSRLADAGPLSERRQDAFNEALARVESAHKVGDHILIQQSEEHLDSVLDEARKARQDETPPAPSFDGGARRSPATRKPVDMTSRILATVQHRRQIAIDDRRPD